MNRLPWCVVILLACTPAPAAEPFELKDGDRVVLLGNTLIEREQRYGYWELALTARYPDRNITFRNLGWSGDTVWGEARAGFGTQADGFKHLKDHVLAEKPTVLIIGYGGNEAFDGPAGLPKFEKGLNDLLDALAPTKARVVLLSPTPHETRSAPINPRQQNENAALYKQAIFEVARKRDCVFVDLFRPHRGEFEKDVHGKFPVPKEWCMTENGMHLTEFGYYNYARTIEKNLAEPSPGLAWSVVIAANGSVSTKGTVKVDAVEEKGRRLRVTPAILSLPIAFPKDNLHSAVLTSLSVQGLSPGKYTLYIDGKAATTGKRTMTTSAAQWAAGQTFPDVPVLEQAEKLRQAIVEKNRLYFHRWRPQNVTYLFGFRSKEQGQNAVEIPKFDPLVAEKEAEIAKLRVPVPHVYELKPE
jgi:lysophospholipase L1-like esterase